MQRSRFSILAGLVALVTVAACSENPNELKRNTGLRATVVSSTATVDQSINTLLALFPASLDNRDAESEGADLNLRATWDQIKKKYVTAQSKPAQMAIVKRKLLRLSDWIPLNAGLMSDPPNDEPKASAATRLVLYMSMYVYAGPSTATPAFSPAADVAVGIVTPDAPATIVTPTTHAGVQLEAGSVAEPTVIVVTQNPETFADNCSGPLQTKLCQYPQFYTFDAFPDKVLLKPAKFNVCHVNTGGKRHVLEGVDHDRLRLAHAKPNNPAEYTEGSTIRDGIEILPLVHQDFSSCTNSVYAQNVDPRGPLGVLSRLARDIRKMVTPKSAYAIDVGLGGISKKMSPFNDVDSIGRPDWKVEGTVSAGPMHPGDHVVITYTISNIGTATGTAVPAAIRLSTDANITPADVLLKAITLQLLPPDSSYTVTDTVVVPNTTTVGSYFLGGAIQDDPLLPDANLANNQASAATAIDQAFVSVPNTLSVGATTACALTGSGVGYCWGENNRRQFGSLSPGVSSSPFAAPIPALASLSGGNAQHFCGILIDGSATCWGRDGFGQLGSGAFLGIANAPVTVVGGINWMTINVSRLTSCGVSVSNDGYCWGHNQRGEIGSQAIAIPGPTPMPHVLDGGHLWKSVVGGWLHACGITTGGATYCWGDNSAGQLGIGTVDPAPPPFPQPNPALHRVPELVVTTQQFIQLSLGTRSTCGITVNHQAFCWGENGTGQIGDGTAVDKAVPTPVAGGHWFSYIGVSPGFPDGSAAGVPIPTPVTPVGQGDVGHTCALTETGQAYCWGWNGNGQLGDGTTTDRLTPTLVPTAVNLTSIALGGSATCGRSGNRIWCWGSNALGQLGNGSFTSTSIPTLVASPFNVP